MTVKPINIKKIPLGAEVDIRLDIDRVDLDFYPIGYYIYAKLQNKYYITK